MSNGITKAQEIKRLTTPLLIENSKAYDCEGNLISCVETLSDVRYIIEPREGILTEDEIMQYAPESKAASKIKLKRGYGTISDVLLVHESLPWLFGLYYTVLLSISVVLFHNRSLIPMVILLVFLVLPLIASYWIFNLKNYEKSVKKVSKKPKVEKNTSNAGEAGVEKTSPVSLKEYEHKVNDLEIVFEVKEKVVKQLIEKKFEPPQITYDKFMAMIDSCHKLFYQEADSARNIVNLAVEDTPRIRGELENKISKMKKIINQIEDLTNELVVNINSDSKDEVKVLLDDMEDLIDSVKDYNGDSNE